MKKLVWIVMVTVIIFVGFGIYSSRENSPLERLSSKRALVGTWVIDCDDDYVDFDSMILKSDGTAIVDGLTANWYAENGVLHFSSVFGNFEYEYKLSGKTLKLTESYYHGSEYKKISS